MARLSVGVVWVATLAEQEALDLHHGRLGTEHLLLALVRRGDAVGRRLAAQGATLAAVRRTVVRLGAGDPLDHESGRPGWSTAAGAAVEAARARARAAGRDEVTTADLAASLVAPGGRAATVLCRLGVDPAVLTEAPGPVTMSAGPPAVPVVPTPVPSASAEAPTAAVPIAFPVPRPADTADTAAAAAAGPPVPGARASDDHHTAVVPRPSTRPAGARHAEVA